jgi:hypothetical protein
MPSPTITPAGPLVKDGDSLTAFASNQDVTWAASAGLLSNVALQSVVWEAPNRTGVHTVSGDNGPDPATVVTITVRALVPTYWKFNNPIHAKKPGVQVFRPIYGPTQTRSSGLGEHVHDWELSNPDSDLEEFEELKAWHLFHYPGKLVDLINPSGTVNERRTYLIDSDLDYEYNQRGGVSWSFRIKEEYPYVVSP